MAIDPPYRFHTLDDMKSFIGGYSNTQYRHLVKVIKKHAVIQPPILSQIPERFDFPLYNVRATVRQIIEDIELTYYTDAPSQQKETNQFDFAEDVPLSYFDLISVLLSQGHNILKKKKAKPEIKAATPQPVKGHSASAKIQDMIDFDELLADMLRHYLNTKERNTGIYIVKSIFLMLAYDPKKLLLDKALLAKCRELNWGSTSDDIYRLLENRLRRIKQNIFSPHFNKLFRMSKEKIIRLKISQNFKSNTIALIDQLSEKKDRIKIERAFKRLMNAYAACASHEELVKASGIMENMLEKLLSFNNFFENKFSQAKTEEFFFLFSSHILRAEKLVKNIIDEVPYLSLFPCKDLHDFYKGVYSGDCSQDVQLATAHLLAPRFFNIRVFDQRKWVGNIYMLDYSDKKALVVDKIQIKSSTSVKSPGFVQRMLNFLSSALRTDNGITLLGPASNISNYAHIEQQYTSYRTKRNQTQFNLDHEDRKIFDCAKSSKFIVLS